MASKVGATTAQRRGGQRSQMGHYGFGEVTGAAFSAGEAGQNNNDEEEVAEGSPQASPGLANTDLDLDRDVDVDFEDDNIDNPSAQLSSPNDEHYDVDDEVRMRARRVIGSKRQSLGDDYDGCSFDEENDSRLVHNVSTLPFWEAIYYSDYLNFCFAYLTNVINVQNLLAAILGQNGAQGHH